MANGQPGKMYVWPKGGAICSGSVEHARKTMTRRWPDYAAIYQEEPEVLTGDEYAAQIEENILRHASRSDIPLA